MTKNLSENRKAHFHYEILETHEAGIELKGFEVKAIKNGHMDLAGTFAALRGREIYLLNANIAPYQTGNVPLDYDPTRSRRLLLKKTEISELAAKMKERGLTLVPLRVYNKGNLVKVEIALCRGKRGPDKRAAIRKREVNREIERTLKS